MLNDVWDRIADGFIYDREQIKDLYPQPKEEPTAQFPFADYLKGVQEPSEEAKTIECPPGYHVAYDAWDTERKFPHCAADVSTTPPSALTPSLGEEPPEREPLGPPIKPPFLYPKSKEEADANVKAFQEYRRQGGQLHADQWRRHAALLEAKSKGIPEEDVFRRLAGYQPLPKREGIEISPGIRVDPDGKVWKEGTPLSIGNIDPQTGKFTQAAWVTGMEGVEWALAPAGLFGQAMFGPVEQERIATRERELVGPEILAEMEAIRAKLQAPPPKVNLKTPEGKAEWLRYIDEQNKARARLTDLERTRVAKVAKASLPGGVAYKEYREKPIWQQLLAESPVWAAISQVGATGIRAALAPAAAKPGLAAIPPTVARGVLYPLAQFERVLGYVPGKIFQRIALKRWTRQQAAQWASLDAETQKIILVELDAILKASPELALRATPETLSKIAYGMRQILRATPAAGRGRTYGIIGELASEQLGRETSRKITRTYARFVLEWARPVKPEFAVEALKRAGFSSEAIQKMTLETAEKSIIGALGEKAAIIALLKAYIPEDTELIKLIETMPEVMPPEAVVPKPEVKPPKAVAPTPEIRPKAVPEVIEAELPKGVRGLSPSELVEARAEMLTLAGYTDDISFRTFLGEHTEYWSIDIYNKAKAGREFKIYRAVPTRITEIHPGAWVTQSKEYAQMHLESVLRGEGHIIEGTARANDLIAMSESEFFYAPEVKAPAVEAPPPVTPPPVTPPIEPTIPPTVPSEGRMMADLQDFSELAEIAFKPDVWRSIANLPAIRNVMNVFGPAATANTPASQAVVGRAMLRHEGQQKTQGVISHLNRLGTQEQVFGKLDDKGLISEGPLKGVSVNTIRTYPERYANKMTPAQKRWVEQANAIEREKLDFLKRNGIEVNELSFGEGGQYAGRRVYAKVKVTEGEPEVLEAAYVGAGPGRPGAKLAVEKHRIFKTEEEAIAAGYRYLPEDEALYLNVSGAYNRVADKQMADWLLLKVPWRTTGAPEELKLASYAAKQKLNRSRMLRAATNRAVRGERVPDATINSIASAYPEQAGRLKALIPKLQAKRPRTATEVQALTREADALIRDNLAEWYRARAATARAREKAMAPAFGEAAIPAPAFAGKILTGPEAKETQRVIMESLAPGFNKALGAVNKVNAVARFFMLAGDLSPMTIQLLFLMGQNPKIYGKAGLGLIKAIFDPEFHANYLTKHNTTIQGSRNLIITKSGATEFTEAMARGGYLSPQRKLLPEEEKLFKKAILLVPRGVAKVGATVLQPFQRGFEASLDVAGIELREAMDYMCTTPERTAGVEQFINEFRGLTSSARIGVGVKTRQIETAAILAPRYNRAIAALLFDTSRGTLRGSLARKSLAKGIAALVALTVAISYARGESTEEVVEHINPTSPKFMTWQVAGQKVGPGSKVRSVLKLFGQSAKDPEKLLELSMDNPGLRWIRGNLSPVISTGYDLLTGRDYIGDPTRDGLLSFSETVAENFMPIWTQTVLLEGGTLGERAVRGGAEFLGMRGYPDPWGKLTSMRDAEAMARYNKPYDELNRLQQKEINQVPEIKELQEQSEAESARRATGFRGEVDDFFAEGDRIEKYRSEELWKIQEQLNRGEITRGAANSAAWKLGGEISGMYEARDRDPRYDKVREYLEEKATEKEKEQEGKEIFSGDKAYYEYQKLFEQADVEDWSSEALSQAIEILWQRYPGAEEYVAQLQEIGKDWPPFYIQYRRTRGEKKTTTGITYMGKSTYEMRRAGEPYEVPTGIIPPTPPVSWENIKNDLDSSLLQTLNRLWYKGESLTAQETNRLKRIHSTYPLGQKDFNTWVKQSLRQFFENSVVGAGKGARAGEQQAMEKYNIFIKGLGKMTEGQFATEIDKRVREGWGEQREFDAPWGKKIILPQGGWTIETEKGKGTMERWVDEKGNELSEPIVEEAEVYDFITPDGIKVSIGRGIKSGYVDMVVYYPKYKPELLPRVMPEFKIELEPFIPHRHPEEGEI